MNSSKDQHLASQKRLQFAVRKLANSSENILFDRSKLYIFVELAHIYCNSSTNSAKKFTFCEMWSILRNVKPANWRKTCELGNAIGMLTTIWQKFWWHTDGILITAEKFRVRTHHNALRFISVSHITVGLAQARPNYNYSASVSNSFRPIRTHILISPASLNPSQKRSDQFFRNNGIRSQFVWYEVSSP